MTTNCRTVSRVLLVILLAALIPQASALIKVVSPEQLRTKYTNITYGLSRFGEIDYRQSTLFKLAVASELDACSFLDHIGDSTKKVALLVTRGNCTFSKKAANGVSVG
jgi:hypothetical protein